MKTEGETYLGDGLYVAFDGWQIRLRAPREGGDHEVYLEPHVFEEFMVWVEALRAAKAEPVE
jgi:hypothetical protein